MHSYRINKAFVALRGRPLFRFSPYGIYFADG
ncbi:unnamed protein product, partial [Rotaria sp. Silwood1]